MVAGKVNRFVFIVVGLGLGFSIAWFTKPGGGSTTTLYDTTIVHVPVHIPYPVEVLKRDTITVMDTIWKDGKIDTVIVIQPTDTAAILSDYYTERTYNDTIKDKDIRIYLDEKVFTNRITNREVSYQILKPTQQNILNYLHGYTSIYYNGGAGVFVGGMYTNDRYMVGLGVDPFSKGIQFTGGIKLYSW